MSNKAGGSYAFVKKERRGRRADLPDDVAKKLKSCSVLGCEEWRDLTSHTTYHCFPTGDKNQQRWEIWTSLLQKAREDTTWIPFRGSLVCSHHFRPEQDFVQDPNQKRTKLMKNAIPSIFPTFQVDLDDPNFILDDSTELEGDNGYYDEYNNTGEFLNQGDNSYDDYDQDDQYIDNPEIAVPEVQYDDEEEDQDLEYAPPVPPIRSRPPKLTPATKPQDFYSEESEPPRKKISLGVTKTENVKKEIVTMEKKPPLTFRGTVNNNTEDFPNSKNMIKAGSSSFSQNSSRSKLYEQLCKSSSVDQKFPIAWNSDLEIEVLESNSNEDSALKLRIEELENEKELLKQKYETQIRALQRKVKDQDRIINEYAVQMNSLKRQRT